MARSERERGISWRIVAGLLDADVRSFTQINSCPSPLPLSFLPGPPQQLSRRQADCAQMFASLQNVLPSSVLSSLSSNPAAKTQPEQDADDSTGRDSYSPSSPSNRAMTVDEQGVKKKKGRSNEVSLSFSAFACAEAPHPRMRFSPCVPLDLATRPISAYYPLPKLYAQITDI
jgi:hypothetical protein